jgi:hypothetical protein
MKIKINVSIRFKTAVFQNMTPCSLIDGNQHFRGTHYLHLQGRGFKSPIILWHVRQKELSLARLRHSKHAMTLLNRSSLLCNGQLINVSAEAVTSCNKEELLEIVFSVGSMQRLYKGVSWVVTLSWVGVSWVSAVCRRIWGWHEMVSSLQGCEPGRRGTSAAGSNMTEKTGLCVIVSWETDARQWGQKLPNMEGEDPLPGNAQWKHSRLRRLSLCCNKWQSVWISNNAVINCSYELYKHARVQ